ncbi:MAG: hypothetical protein JXR94_00765 [Candidatus Hydrogenedentes bacterium]|nr:hypothetical protein [Candidatus Hydrogenedentota bacterium]
MTRLHSLFSKGTAALFVGLIAGMSVLTTGCGDDPNIVYVNPGEDVYHLKGCSFIRADAVKYRIEDVIAQGYKPCDACPKPEDGGAQESSIVRGVGKDGKLTASSQQQVWVSSADDKYYHREDCEVIKSAPRKIQYAKPGAEMFGYKPCKKCKP